MECWCHQSQDCERNLPELEGYRKSKPNEYLVYLDANNLYRWAMSQPLPTSDFKWRENICRLDLSTVSANSCRGYILKADLGRVLFMRLY